MVCYFQTKWKSSEPQEEAAQCRGEACKIQRNTCIPGCLLTRAHMCTHAHTDISRSGSQILGKGNAARLLEKVHSRTFMLPGVSESFPMYITFSRGEKKSIPVRNFWGPFQISSLSQSLTASSLDGLRDPIPHPYVTVSMSVTHTEPP